MGISVVRVTAQYGEREGEQAQRYVKEKIYCTSTNLVETDNWSSQHNINSSSLTLIPKTNRFFKVSHHDYCTTAKTVISSKRTILVI